MTIYAPAALVLKAFGIRFLVDRVVGKSFGHLVLDPALYIMDSRLQGRSMARTVMIMPPWRLANRALLDYWRGSVFVVGNPIAATILTPFNWFPMLAHQIYAGDRSAIGPAGETIPYGPSWDQTIGLYALEHGTEPMLVVTSQHQRNGQQALRELGMPEGSWWVCFHVRTAGYYQQFLRKKRNVQGRNANVESYFDAMRAVVKRGGWVIRMGDPSMPTLPQMDRVIDYAHSNIRADWMDMYLFGSCRFMVGSDSGPTAVAMMFGRPVANTNYIPMGHGSLGPLDVYIPKLYRSLRDGRLLPFREILSTPLRDLSPPEFEKHGVAWVNNTPTDIRLIAEEMMDRLESISVYTDDDERAQIEFHRLMNDQPTAATYGTHSRLGRDFLREHSDLLWESADELSGR
jgi:putative glycosyltransferase (TIGR04372 family)